MKDSRFAGRIALCAALVVVCHAFEWEGLRAVTTRVVVWLCSCMVSPPILTGPTTARYGGVNYLMEVSCTLIDCYLASLAFLWNPRESMLRNAWRFAVWGCILFFLNVIRLAAGVIGIQFGMPWWFGHELLGGLFYAAIAVCLWDLQIWRKPLSFRAEFAD